MEAFLAEWGSEIILSLVIAILTYWYKKSDKEKDKQAQHYQELLEEERTSKLEERIERHLEPLYKDLEEIRQSVINLAERHDLELEDLENRCKDWGNNADSEWTKKHNILEANLKLIISSYRYRLVELCKSLEAQGFMYQYQREHLMEFFHLYENLGGNGQAKEWYDHIMHTLPVKPNPEGYYAMV